MAEDSSLVNNDDTGFKRKRMPTENDSDEENKWPSKRSNVISDESDDTTLSESEICVQTNQLTMHTPFYSISGLTYNRNLVPLPNMAWADRCELWKEMIIRDELFCGKRDPNTFDNHPALTPRMRTILLDWLSEVCEVYRMHRETYFLAIDFLDRYLSNTQDLPKTQLQLLGVTCLFIAAKIEEIYPPKLSEFAYVTDGACSDTEIILKELVVLKKLDWDLTPMTINYWLTVYMQMYKYKTDQLPPIKSDYTFIFPQFSVMDYEQAITLCTLAAWDVEMLKFSYRTIAAAALYYISNRDTALTLSQLSWNELETCIDWMYPFAMVMKDNCYETVYVSKSKQSYGRTGLQKFIPNIHFDESHNLQKHSVNMDLFQLAVTVSPKTPSKTILSTDTPVKKVMLTPPTSGRKPADE